MKGVKFIFLFILFVGCKQENQKDAKKPEEKTLLSKYFLIVLGTLQDGGSPHIGCKKECCRGLFGNPDNSRKVVSLGIVDPDTEQNYLIEATPDLPEQLRLLKNYSEFKNNDKPDAVFLTHAHIGHYAGLMYFGKEAMNADSVNVYAMPRMKNFLESNGPWNQLILLNNISLQTLEEEKEIKLSSYIKVRAFRVPHRDEYSETVGYKIEGPHKQILFIPDIDKWSKWNKSIAEEIKKVDYALIDGTFYDGQEINNRDISEIPHPFVTESMELFKSLPANEKNKIYFIHLNHTNPLLDTNSKQTKHLLKNGYHVAFVKQAFQL